jgi:medium-chain acyl-[acyl-carrier-protein] hydrolase
MIQTRSAGAWVIDDASGAEPRPAWRLFCFPHAGGGPSFFRPWHAALQPEIAVRRVLLPGREWRLDELAFRRMADLIEPLCAGLEPYLDEPYAFFGHSMGAVVAYEAARRFSAGGRTGPSCLIVSGRRAPALPGRDRALAGLPDDEFAAEVARLNGIPPQVLGEPDLLAMLLPTLRADYELAETYRPLDGGQLDCPVIGYLGASDPETDYQRVLSWREVTTGEFTTRVFRGDHFYLKGGRADVLNAVREDLRRVAGIGAGRTGTAVGAAPVRDPRGDDPGGGDIAGLAQRAGSQKGVTFQ